MYILRTSRELEQQNFSRTKEPGKKLWPNYESIAIITGHSTQPIANRAVYVTGPGLAG